MRSLPSFPPSVVAEGGLQWEDPRVRGDSHFRENTKGRSQFGIVASRFNRPISDRLVQGALDFFRQKRIPAARVRVVQVPGAFELAGAAMRMAGTGRYRAIVAVGCILEGETPHHRYLSQATLTGILMAGVLSGVPVTCGVITARDWKIALARSQPKGLNRGREAAKAAWELAHDITTPRVRHGSWRMAERHG